MGKQVLLEALNMDEPLEVERTIDEEHRVADEKESCIKGWWLMVAIAFGVWLLYPFIGPKGGPAPITHMPYDDALLECLGGPVIFVAVMYYALIYRLQRDIDSSTKMVLKTTIKKLSKDKDGGKVTLEVSCKKAKRFFIRNSSVEIDPAQPVVICYLKRTKTVLSFAQEL